MLFTARSPTEPGDSNTPLAHHPHPPCSGGPAARPTALWTHWSALAFCRLFVPNPVRGQPGSIPLPDESGLLGCRSRLAIPVLERLAAAPIPEVKLIGP